MSEPEGPQPEDFEVEADPSEVRASQPGDEIRQAEVRQDVAAPLSTARGGITLSIKAPR